MAKPKPQLKSNTSALVSTIPVSQLHVVKATKDQFVCRPWAVLSADKRLDVVYSQPADTGTGTNVNTQLVYALDYLKVSPVHKRNAHYLPYLAVYSESDAAARYCHRNEHTPRHRHGAFGKVQVP